MAGNVSGSAPFRTSCGMEGKKRASESDAEAFPSKRRTPCKNPTLVIVGGDAKPQQAIFLRLSRSARSIQMPIAIPLNALRGCAGRQCMRMYMGYACAMYAYAFSCA